MNPSDCLWVRYSGTKTSFTSAEIGTNRTTKQNRVVQNPVSLNDLIDVYKTKGVNVEDPEDIARALGLSVLAAAESQEISRRSRSNNLNVSQNDMSQELLPRAVHSASVHRDPNMSSLSAMGDEAQRSKSVSLHVPASSASSVGRNVLTPTRRELPNSSRLVYGSLKSPLLKSPTPKSYPDTPTDRILTLEEAKVIALQRVRLRSEGGIGEGTGTSSYDSSYDSYDSESSFDSEEDRKIVPNRHRRNQNHVSRHHDPSQSLTEMGHHQRSRATQRRNSAIFSPQQQVRRPTVPTRSPPTEQSPRLRRAVNVAQFPSTRAQTTHTSSSFRTSPVPSSSNKIQ